MDGKFNGDIFKVTRLDLDLEMPSKFYLKYAKTNLSHSYVFLDGEFNGGIFKVTRPELDLEMTLKHLVNST